MRPPPNSLLPRPSFWEDFYRRKSSVQGVNDQCRVQNSFWNWPWVIHGLGVVVLFLVEACIFFANFQNQSYSWKQIITTSPGVCLKFSKYYNMSSNPIGSPVCQFNYYALWTRSLRHQGSDRAIKLRYFMALSEPQRLRERVHKA